MEGTKTSRILRLAGEVWREGSVYTAYCRELDLASCGRTVEEAWRNLHQVFQIFVEETTRKGTLHSILQEAGMTVGEQTVEHPEHFIGRIEVALPS